MTAPFPPPDATREQVEVFEAEQRAASKSKAGRSEANLHRNSVCTSCGCKGHRRGVAACPNYDSPVRWQAHGKIWVRP